MNCDSNVCTQYTTVVCDMHYIEHRYQSHHTYNKTVFVNCDSNVCTQYTTVVCDMHYIEHRYQSHHHLYKLVVFLSVGLDLEDHLAGEESQLTVCLQHCVCVSTPCRDQSTRRAS